MIGSRAVLRRAPDIGIDLASNAGCTITVAGRSAMCSSHALAILDAFAAPRACGDVIEVVGKTAKSPADWLLLTACIQQLIEVGALYDDAAGKAVPSLTRVPSFDHAAIHVAMLDDRGRTGSFVRALREVVGPDDVVVDIGTGTGVLAVAAAQAGAKHVYAIEATRMADVATEVIRENGLEDRITVVRGWSMQVSLPERATVLVTEIVGNEPLSEDALLVTWDARKRLLTPDARFIPGAMRMHAVPVMVPDAVVARRFFTQEAASRWKDWYGIGFDSLVAFQSSSTTVVNATEARAWTPLATSACFPEIDFRRAETTLDMSAKGTMTSDGVLGAVVVYFELELCPGVAISTSPWNRADDCHWRTPVWLMKERTPVRKGDTFEVSYKFAKPGGDLTLRLL